MDNVTIDSLLQMNDLIGKQIDFQNLLGNEMPKDIVLFENVKTALEHNIYQQIEFQEFMEADSHDKKEELIDYLLFMINKYIFLGIKCIDSSIFEKLWDDNVTESLSSASHYASIEQSEFINLVRHHCTFKPWKAEKGENCVDIEKVHDAFNFSLNTFKRIARMTYNSYYDLYSNIIKKLMINIDRQKSGY